MLKKIILLLLAGGFAALSAWELVPGTTPLPKGKSQTVWVESKQGKLLELRGNSAFRVKLDPSEYAGKRCELICDHRLENVPVKAGRSSTYGFKVMLTYKGKGKTVYNHAAPLTGSSNWSTQKRFITFPADLSSLWLTVSIPGGKAQISKLSLKEKKQLSFPAQKEEGPVQTLAPVKNAPVADGKFSLKEWGECAAEHNFIAKFNGMRSKRNNSVFFGYDRNSFYFCQASALPPAPQKISPKDKTELEFILPDGKKKLFFFTADGKHNFPAGSRFASLESGKTQVMPGIAGAPIWLTEVNIPWKGFGLKAAPEKQVLQMQIRRLWRNPEEISLLSFPSPRLQLRFDREQPMIINHVWVHGVSARMNMSVRNVSAQTQKVHTDLLIRSVEAPHRLNKDVTAPSGKTENLFQYFMVGGPQDRHLDITVTDSKSKSFLYRRSFEWNVSQGQEFFDPDPPVTMNFGFSPTQKRLIAKVECRAAKKLADVKEIRFKVIDQDNILVSEVRARKRNASYFDADWKLPELALGKYTVSAEIIRKNGKKEILSKYFQMRNFLWENTNIGMERTVPPPFKPLQSKGSQVHALQTGYEADGVFWSKVFAQKENILAAPVTLRLNGKTFRKISEKWLERSSDLVVRESRHQLPGMDLSVRHEYEFDGMCKTILKFTPDKGQKCSSLYIDIPLKEEYAKLYHHTANGIRSNPSEWIPRKNGQAWRFVRNALHYPFYIWFGETFKGFCHFSDMTPPLFDNVSSPVTHEFIRQGKSVVLRIHLAGKGKLKPFEYVCGFQPTPVKPRPRTARQWGGSFWTAVLPNAYMYYTLGHTKHHFAKAKLGLVYTPYNNDYTFMDYLFSGKSRNESRQQINARIAAFMKKNNMTNEKWERLLENGRDSASLSDRMRHASIFSRNKLISIYLNPRAGFRNWPESETYDDEWMGFAFRNPDDNLYHRRPTKTFTDKLLYETRDFLRRFPQCAGLYFDNLYPSGALSVFQGSRELAPGQYAFVCDIFQMREMMKRSLRLAAQEKRFLPEDPAYPWIEAHMTDANIVPVMGLATRTLNWEMKFGRQLWQQRFPESFHYVQSLGTQTGTIPLGIVSTGGTKAERLRQHRSLYAVGFAFDMLNFTDPGSREEQGSPLFNAMQFLVRRFGYGTKDVEHFPGYLPEKNPVKCTPSRVRITTCKHKNGQVMLLVGNLGKKATVKLDLSKFPVKNLKNAETGHEIRSNTFELESYDCAVLIGKWK